MLSNNEIVEDVAKTYRIKSLIIKMIDYSLKDRSCDDLEQYIYEYLLGLDNAKLNDMYEPIKGDPNKSSNKLRKFISQIIVRQRNGGMKGNNTDYVKYFRIHNSNEVFYFKEEEEYEDIETDVYNYLEEFIKVENRQYTIGEIKKIFKYTLLYKSKIDKQAVWKMAKHLDFTPKLLYTFIKDAKKDLKRKWFDTELNFSYLYIESEEDKKQLQDNANAKAKSRRRRI
jgi:hypothetical protein